LRRCGRCVSLRIWRGFSYTAGVKRRRILPVATGNKYCGLVILFDVEKIEPVAIMPDGVIQKVRVAAMSAVGCALFGS